MKFKNNVPYSEEFDDIYFNTDSAIGESQYVFASAVDEIWNKTERFIVAEAGFGAGRNFLSLCKKFKNTKKFLHYVGIEKFPLSKNELKTIYTKISGYEKEFWEFIKKYSDLKAGINRIYYSKNIILDICIGDINEIINELDFEADIWFLDGFSPSKNKDMWSEALMLKIANLSKVGTIVTTYSSSVNVQNALKKAKFDVIKLPGFGKKRNMIKAYLTKKFDYEMDIWFKRPKFELKGKKIVVIGGGIAGCTSAFKLKNLGFDVVLAEKRYDVAANASGNYAGILQPLITKPGVTLGKMHLSSFSLAKEFYKTYLLKNLISFCGCIEFAFNDDLVKKYSLIKEDDNFKFILKAKPYPAVFIKKAAIMRPAKTCKYICKNFKVLTNHEFIGFEAYGQGYNVYFKNKNTIYADIIIFCMGSESEELFNSGLEPKEDFDPYMQISSVRGQVTLIKQSIKTKSALSSKSYICPAIKGIQLIGATYDRKVYFDKSRELDDIKNLENIEEFLQGKKVKIIDSKVAYRSYSGDRFPVIGALHDSKWFIKNYKNLMWRKNKNLNLHPRHINNVYINACHGSRGLSTAVMGAELLCDYILNRPLCVTKNIANELNPARFLVRKLKKGLIK